MTNVIPYTKERALKAAIAELIEDHVNLKREVDELREHNRYLESRVSEDSDYATLRAENERLQSEIADRQGTEESLTKWVSELGDDVDRLKGEVERLRDVAEVVVSDLFYQIDSRHGTKLASEYPSIVKARAALSRP